MLQTLLKLERQYSIVRHENAPLLHERETFLEHLHQQGTSLAAMRSISWQLLNVIQLLKLDRLREVTFYEVEQASQVWAEQQRSNPRAQSYAYTGSYFLYVAKKWLRFLGKLKMPTVPRMRFADHVEDFAQWMTDERGMSPQSVRSHCWKTSQFLKWFSQRHRLLSRVRITDIDEFLIFKGAHGWSRKSISVATQALRAFFRYAEECSWCVQGIADSIESPRLYVHEGLPEGPEWKDARRLLENLNGKSPTAKRTKAILSLFVMYGLRSGEVSSLLISDFDWRAETFTVRHSKRGGVQQYPLQYEVGEAILEYLMEARPRATCRNLFLTLRPPYRPIGASVLWSITSRQLSMLNIQLRRRGPHCLRHTCATHLLECGASLKEIGDLLGHRDAASTGIYAKVHLQQLRRVADFDLGGLL